MFDIAKNVVDRRFNIETLFVADSTPHEVIFKEALLSVRFYSSLSSEQIESSSSSAPPKIPVVLIPPLGVAAWIFDLLPSRSLVKFLLDRNFCVYLIDWGEPNRAHAHLSLENYVIDWFPKALTSVRLHSKQANLSLVGYCMGGLLSLMYAAYSKDEYISNIVVLGSPIDFHSSGSMGKILARLNKPLSRLSKLARISLLDLKPGLFHVPGKLLSFSFNLTSPFSSIRSRLDLLIKLADREYVAMHTTTSRWFNEMLDYPGAMVQSVIVQLGLSNSLSRDILKLAGSPILFSSINAPIFAVAGMQDKIVSVEAVTRLLEMVSSLDKTLKVVPGGHAGLFAGAKAPETTWAYLSDWLSLRS